MSEKKSEKEKDFEQKRNRVLEINDELKRLEEEKKHLLRKLQKACAHQLVIQISHKDREHYHIPPSPIRICFICGLKGDWLNCHELSEVSVTRNVSTDKFWKYRSFGLPLKPLDGFNGPYTKTQAKKDANTDNKGEPDFISKAAEKAKDMPEWKRQAGFRTFHHDRQHETEKKKRKGKKGDGK